MSRATAKAVIDPRARKGDGRSTVIIRVTFDRKHAYYKTNIVMEPKAFEKLMAKQKRTDAENKTYGSIKAYTNKANEVFEKLPVFTFALFEKMYLSNREASDTVSAALQNYENELLEEGRLGSAIACGCARRSLDEFCNDQKMKGLRFADVTPKLLKRYQDWMEKKGRTLTTVGIYMRGLRRVFNLAAVDKALYPFGAGKYEIPNGKNVKKALTLEEIGKIMNYQAERGSFAERARDYWLFLYFSNGMNVKDFCLLKHSDIDMEDGVISYVRAKTVRTKKEREKIRVSLKPFSREVIRKWGIPSLHPDTFVFPHLRGDMTLERQREVYQQLTQNINKNMKRIAKELGINKPITTYYARHSFATVLKRSGVSTEFISEALGHSDLLTTKSYLAGFETDQIHAKTECLIPNAV